MRRKRLRINLLFLIDWISHVARQKKNADATQEVFWNKTTKQVFTFFNLTSDLQVHIGLAQQQHCPESTISKNTRRISHGQPTITHESHIPIQRKRPEIMETI